MMIAIGLIVLDELKGSDEPTPAVVKAQVQPAPVDPVAAKAQAVEATAAARTAYLERLQRAAASVPSFDALAHTKLESTVRYLGIEVDDALLIAEQVEL